MKNRLLELDCLRGLAALAVMLFHYTTHYDKIYGHRIELPFYFPGGGEYGVQLFFIISGFVIFLTLDKTRHPLDFVVSRISRLYPAYWVAVILTFSCVAMFGLPGREVSVETALTNLSMLQRWAGFDDVDGVYWTLALELSFYAIMLLLFSARLLGKIEMISAFWLSLILILAILEKHLLLIVPSIVKISFLLKYGNLFIAGMTFYRMRDGVRPAHLLLILTCLYVEFYLHGPVAAAIIGTYFCIFMLFVFKKLGFIALRPLIFLGSISYSLYLVHQNIGYIIINNLYSHNVASPWLILGVPILISMGLASLMYTYVENPSMKYLRNKWRHSRVRSSLTHAGRRRAETE